MTRDIVAVLAQKYLAKPGNSVGGNLHIVLDDGNLEERHLLFCAKQARANADTDGVDLANLLLQLSMTQRRKLYNNHWTD